MVDQGDITTPPTATPAGPSRATSLRSRWNRSFALLTVLVLLVGIGTFTVTRLLVDSFRDSAVKIERQATTSAQLRNDLVAHSVLLATESLDAHQNEAARLQRAVDAGFTQVIADENTPAARSLLTRARRSWQEIVLASGPPGLATDIDTRGEAVRVSAPETLSLLDEAGTVSRAAVRADLARASLMERRAIAILAALEALAIFLVVRLARRLTAEVLVPVSLIRDSANHLAAGELDHRIELDEAVEIDGGDEIGELAASFNAMADAIAGNQRSLTLEANTDSLTGLANRAAFRARLGATLARPQRRSGDQAVLFVDLDDFKDVNDSMGHAASDELLRVAATRLLEAVRPGDMAARLGGDEFALLLDGLQDPGVATIVAERVVSALAEPVTIGEVEVRVGASVGLAARQDDSTLASLMRQADVAMYAAKAKGKSRVERYDGGLDDEAVARQLLRADVGFAVARGELVLEYQPVVDLDDGSLVGLEALVRWEHPVRGYLPPCDFIDLAEETGDIIGLGHWVLETATRQLKVWQRAYSMPDLWISVNVSVRQLDTLGFADDVRRSLDATGIRPETLVLEVTESVLADPDRGTASTLAQARTLGARIALDDFGTGYSSISYLRELPVDILKIDRSFVVSSDGGGAGEILLESIVAMAQRLGLDVIPEGIEDVRQLKRLRAMGCGLGQGYLLARPMPPRRIEELLAAPMPLPDRALWEAIQLMDLTPTSH